MGLLARNYQKLLAACLHQFLIMSKTNHMFDYEECDEGKLEFFKHVSWHFDEWCTDPFKELSIGIEAIDDLTKKEKIDFIDKYFKDAYLAENKRRRSRSGDIFYSTSLDCIYVTNTPENLSSIEQKQNKISRYRLEDDGTILVADLGKWDRIILNHQFYSNRVMASFCRKLGINKNDIDSERGVVWG